MRVGIEVGGTFTDLVAVEGGTVLTAKVPSTPASPDLGAMHALDAAGLDPAGSRSLSTARPWRPTPCSNARAPRSACS